MFSLEKFIPIDSNYSFMSLRKAMLLLSSFLTIISILLLIFKGLNLGIDFKGGTLIEVSAENIKTNIAELRQSLLKMNLGDVAVKKFGTENDYLVKI